MNNGELIKKLKEFPAIMEVTISDGYDYNFYSLQNKNPDIVEYDDELVLRGFTSYLKV